MLKCKRISSIILALAICLCLSIPAFATESTLQNGEYTAKIAYYNASNPSNLSMSAVLFDTDAEILVTDDTVTITTYVIYPVPAYPTMGTAGTLTSYIVTYGGKTYNGALDITTKPIREFDVDSTGFGVTAGQGYETEVITITLPREAIGSFESGLAVTSFVNVVMNMDVNFVVKISDMSATASESTTQSVEVTAEVAAPSSTYSVVIPETVALGSLSTDMDNAFEYKVEVSAKNMNGGHVEVSAPTTGKLISGANELAFSNTFGTQKSNEDVELTGEMTVAAADVVNAVAGNYTGTTTFVISYYAG